MTNDKKFFSELALAIGAVLALTLALIAIAILAIPIHAVILKFAWNYVMPGIFGLPKIGYIQSLALVLIARILIKSSSSSHSNSK